MKKADFEQFFIQILEKFAELGVFHYNADAAKKIHLVIQALEPQLEELRQRIEALESKPKRKKKVDNG